MMRAITLMLFVILVSIQLYATKLVIRVDYRPARKQQETRDIVKDNYWTLPVTTPPALMDPSRYYLVLNFSSDVIQNERLDLVGLYAEPRELLLVQGANLVIRNHENIARKFVVVNADGETVKEIVVEPEASFSYNFSRAGEYKLKDEFYFWNSIVITVLDESQQVRQIRRKTEVFTIPDVNGGSYNLKIYRGVDWIFQEDFTVVPTTHEYPLSYIIKNGNVLRNDAPVVTPAVNIDLDGRPE